MHVAVCIKRVPETGARITLTADEQEIDTSYLGFTISPHEECAVEEALRLVERHGGTTTAVTLGPPAAAEQLRNAVAMGVESARPARDGAERLGSAGDGRRPGRCAPRRRPRPAPLRQRVGRLGRLPGRHPRRARARPSLRDRGQGDRDRGRHGDGPPRGGRRLGDLRGAAAGRPDREGGDQPARATRRSRAGCARRRPRSCASSRRGARAVCASSGSSSPRSRARRSSCSAKGPRQRHVSSRC